MYGNTLGFFLLGALLVGEADEERYMLISGIRLLQGVVLEGQWAHLC